MKDYMFTTFGSIWRHFLIITCVVCLSGCSLFGLFGKDDGKDPEIAADETAAKLYKSAHRKMIARQFLDAIEEFKVLESRYPFGRYASQAQLELAYAYYKINNTDSAIDSVNRFIKLNPQHPSID